MKRIEINSSEEFESFCSLVQYEKDSQLIVHLQNDVKHYHAIRFAKKKIVHVINETVKEINYFINLRFGEEIGHSKYINESDFFFGGEKESLYLFSNLTFKLDEIFPFNVLVEKDLLVFNRYGINNGKEIIDAEKVLFLNISHDSKVTFFDCTFVNDTDKKFVIETLHNAVVEFINCEFKGDFEFISHQNSIISK